MEPSTNVPATAVAGEKIIRTIAAWLTLLGILVITGRFLLGIFSVGLAGQGYFTNITPDHFPAVVGLPAAALAALGLVTFLEHRAGKMQFKVLGFEFNGASGPAVIWSM